MHYKNKSFCTARCDNLKCPHKIGYSQMRHAEKLKQPVKFDDLSKGCKEQITEDKQDD